MDEDVTQEPEPPVIAARLPRVGTAGSDSRSARLRPHSCAVSWTGHPTPTCSGSAM
ncbi:MAG: hypothetical protein ACLUOF_12830 [Ruminococcus sp.]